MHALKWKKLELGPSKCHSIHVGQNRSNCPNLKAHNTDIKQQTSALYLGDQVRFDGLNNESVDARRNSGIGAISQIFSFVEADSLGPFYFEILFTMRDSILLSKIIYSTEVWYSITKENIKKLEEIDELFWHKTFEVCRTVCKESLYIISGKIPIRFILIKRRLMYWWHLCNTSNQELIKRVYNAQCTVTHHTDWVHQVKQDLKSLNITLSDKDLSQVTKCQFKKYLDVKINSATKVYLESMRNSHSKSKYLPSFNGKPDTYLSSKSLNKLEKINMIKLKTRMVNVAENFKGSKDLSGVNYAFCFTKVKNTWGIASS